MAVEKNNRAIITAIERFAVHDGPGIRTLVFIKGCPLHCPWCSNPETQVSTPQLVYTHAKCLKCGRCVEVCEVDALELTTDGILVDRERCTICGQCVEQCVSEALDVAGQFMSPAEVFEEVEKDAIFYRVSGGGVTLSGGEPLASPKFCSALLSLCKEAGFHTAIETCGHVPWRSFEAVLPFLDLVLFDVKHMDPRRHEQDTGVSNEHILENLTRLDQTGVEIVVRLPLIPGFNDSIENIQQTAAFASRLSHAKRVDMLPYHRLGKPKYEKLGIKYESEELVPPDRKKVENLRRTVESFGLEVTIGG
jgi:pyruvate formate lyase activating enzyme